MERDLRDLIVQLRDAIGRDDREEMERLVDRVERQLGDDDDEPDDDLLTELQRAEVRFENDHPTLASALRRAIDVLSSAGI